MENHQQSLLVLWSKSTYDIGLPSPFTMPSGENEPKIAPLLRTTVLVTPTYLSVLVQASSC